MALQTTKIQQMALVASARQTAVVAIGAATGDPAQHDEALRTFFAALPNDLGVAYIVMLSAPPGEPTALPTVLAGCTTMPVIALLETVPIKPDHIYGLPTHHALVVTDGTLQVTPLAAMDDRAFGLDAFFSALAPTAGDGFALRLAGHDREGVAGIKAFKARGGFVLLQAPVEAPVNEMPATVMATNLADLHLPLNQLAPRLVDLVHSKAQLSVTPEQLAKDDAMALAQIIAYVEGRTGHDFSGYDQATILRGVVRRMRCMRRTDYAVYLHYLRTDPAEVQRLCTELLMTFPTFFQDPVAFDQLTERVIPKLFAGKAATESIRVWIAGCATGEEVYSLAFLLLEQAKTLANPPSVQIFATDLDDQALAFARAGRYPAAVVDALSSERLQLFFVEEDSHYQVKQMVRERIIFSHHNLLHDPPFARLDLIVCRNLLAKFNSAAQKQVIALFHYALHYRSTAPGYLFLGQEDGGEAAAWDEFWQPLEPAHGIFISRSVQHPDAPRLPDLYKEWQHSHPSKYELSGATKAELHAHQLALEAAAPPSILVDSARRAIHFSESAGRYLRLPGGSMSSEVVRIVRPELKETLRTALVQALDLGQESFTAPVAVHFDGTQRRVHLLVSPVRRQTRDETQALILFIDTGPFVPARNENGAGASILDRQDGHEQDSEIARLQAELTQVRHQLESSRAAHSASTEQQHTANEELQAINEEYRTIAEELQSSKEELQSLNEELQTVNVELKEKLHEISQAHSDLQNLMAVAEVGTLFLDRSLRIRRFTAPVTRIFNIEANDRGRPITDLTHQLIYTDLMADARRVMEELAPIEEEISSVDGCTYLVRLRPYRTVYHKIDGVVITFVDITKHKVAEAALRASEERFRTMADNIAQLAWMTDPSGWITWYNKRWYEYTGTTFAMVKGWGWQKVHHPDHVERVVQKIRQHFARGEVWEDLFPLRNKAGEYRWFLSHAFPIHNEAGEIVRWFGTNTDVTEQRETEAALRRLNETLEERVEERTVQVRVLASKLTMSEQEERRRIAQILHDDLQQLLYGIQMRMDLIVLDAEAGETAILARYAHEAYGWLDSAIRTTRQLTVDISPPVLEGEGLSEALQWLATQMAEINGLQVKISTAEHLASSHEIHQDMRVLLFHIVRELLFNVVKHAATNQATVTIGPVTAGTLTITVQDAGRGFDVAAAEAQYMGGFGLFSLRERLGLFGGQLKIRSTLGAGTSITLAIPIARPDIALSTQAAADDGLGKEP